MKIQSSKLKAQSQNLKLKTFHYGDKKTLIIDILNGNNDPVNLAVGENQEVIYVLVSIENQGKKEVIITLDGKEANAQILGIIINRKGTCSIRTLQHHRQPDTTSDLLIKTVLFGKAKFNYRGLIKIDKKAQRSNAYQRDENLLLSSKVKVDTRPELEIKANDVRCTHGATIGKIDEEILFYLMSRGIKRKRAEKLVIEGFFEPVLERIPDGRIVKETRRKIQEALQTVMV